MLQFIKKFFDKAEKDFSSLKEEIKFNNTIDLQSSVDLNKENKSETKLETKSSLTFGK